MPTSSALLVPLSLLLAASSCSRSSSGDEPSAQPSASTAGVFQELSSPEGRFSIRMLPGAKRESSRIDKPEGTIETVTHLASTREGRAYSIAYTDYPDAIWKAKSPDEMLDGARDGAASRMGGKLGSEKKVTLDSAPGREILITGNDKPVTARVRMAMVDGRLYMLQALSVGSLHDIPDPDADRFFDSFRLAKK